MTDKEVIKALECCSNWNITKCFECPYVDYDGSCINKSKTDALDLINRQQAEIEMLKTQKNIYSKQFADALGSIERLDKLNETARVDAIKEFAEKFDKVLAEMRDAYFEDDHVSYGLVCETVHARLSRFTKEMVGADNG